MASEHTRLLFKESAATEALRPRGAITVYNRRYYFLDVYYWLMKMSMFGLVAISVLMLLFVALVFALLLLPVVHVVDPVVEGYWELFSWMFKSIIGMSTPYTSDSLWVEFVLSIVSLSRTFMFCILTGLFFSHFARPEARIQFSDNALITVHRGQRKFMFRVANERAEVLINIRIDVTLLISDPPSQKPSTPSAASDSPTTPTAVSTWRSYYDLPLLRSSIPVAGFSLPWTVMHMVDENSVLSSHSAYTLARDNARFFVTFAATDLVFGSGIFYSHSYSFEEVLWDHEFVDMFSRDALGHFEVDLGKLSAVRKQTPSFDEKVPTSVGY